MNRSNLSYLLIALLIPLAACESLVEGVNDNPNDVLADEVSPELFLTGAQLANVSAQVGHSNRIAGMYSGQLVGAASLYSNIYGFNISTVESNNTWSRIYVGAVTNLRTMRSISPNDALLQGIAKVTEAHAVGTAASIFGDVPYSQINDPEFPNPVFDNQVDVFNALLSLLDEAISDLSSASSRGLSQDIHFGGDADKWLKSAYTLKARYHLHLKEYSAAYSAALQGIDSENASMKYMPTGDALTTEGDKNLFFMILEGSRAGDIGTFNSYLMQLLNPENPDSRNHTKTNETARHGYFTIDASGGSANQGVVSQFEPQNMVTYAENLLILAETAVRTDNLSQALDHLNTLRAWMNQGNHVNNAFQSAEFKYDPFILSDFEAGGLENPDELSTKKALLKEIIEERYVSGFGMFMPFDDARRLRTTDPDIQVPFEMVDGPTPPFAERLPYSDDELNSNANAPSEDPGIFTKTRVNQ